MKPPYYILDDDGNPEPVDSLYAWAEWLRLNQNEKRVKHTTLCSDEVRVSTVFLSIDHGWGMAGDPVLWETMVFGGVMDLHQERFTSRAAAVERHDELVNEVLAMEALA